MRLGEDGHYDIKQHRYLQDLGVGPFVMHRQRRFVAEDNVLNLDLQSVSSCRL